MRPVSSERQIEAVSLLGRYLWQDHSLEDTLSEAARLAAVAAGADAAVVLECASGHPALAAVSYTHLTLPTSDLV